MGFQIQCPNKECRKDDTAILDVTLDKVFCSDCDAEITDSFTKSSMRTLGQTQKSETKTAFSVKCQCGKQDTPDIKGKEAFCKSCKKKLNVTETFIKMMQTTKYTV